MAIKILTDIREHAMTFAGKPGMNPFLYINTHIRPLKTAYESGNRSEDLFNKIIALKKVDPKIPEVPQRKAL
jgi:hypothetical protein